MNASRLLRKHTSLLPVLFFLTLFISTGRVCTQNLLLNAGFETATVPMPGGTPIPSYPNELDHWTAVTVDGEFIYDLTKAHSGTGFLSVLQNAGANPVTDWLGIPSVGGYDRAGQQVAVSPSTQYELSFWYKYGDGSRYGYGQGNVVLQVEQVLPTNATIHSQIIPTTASWQYISLNFTTGANASEIIVLFSGVGPGNVDIWIDDVRLIDSCAAHVDLGNDTTLCPGQSLLLDATGLNIDAYLWQDNSTNATFNVTQPGTYWVEVTSGGCSVTDTIHIGYNVPNVSLGNDTTLCTGSTLVKDVTTPNATYLWQDNSTNPTFTITQPGTYWVEITVGNCSSTDTIQVNFAAPPVIDLGNDTTICFNTSLTLDATTPNATYLWQDNSTNATLTVNFPGIYWVNVNMGGCISTDTIQVSMAPIPAVDLGNDITVCGDNGVVLNVTTTDATYLWQDNSTNATFAVTQTGVYHVTVNVNGCSSSDTVAVTVIPVAVIDLPDTNFCEGDSLLLDASPAGGDTYVWQDSSTASTYQVTQPGLYWVEISASGCTYTDSILVELKDCEVTLEMPNVFTPNGDGVNDSFIPLDMKGITEAKLIIYNRWGVKLFESTDLAAGWNGEFNGNICAEGTYYWIVPYTDIFNHSEVLNGFLTLVK